MIENKSQKKIDNTCYKMEQLATLAGRDNNTKRPWLLVNPLQGKHIPCSPREAFQLFSALASSLYKTFPSERLLVIGFAETATAIGAAIAACAPGDALYIPTTRESLPGREYLYFSESHSHATEQKLVKDGLEILLSGVDRVIFAEDEVTTGNTILNAIHAISREYETLPLKYGVVSILNGMTDQNRAIFRERGISCTYLMRLNHENYSERISSCRFNPELCFNISPDDSSITRSCAQPDAKQAAVTWATTDYGRQNLNDKTIPTVRTVRDYENPRLGVKISSFLEKCAAMTERILSSELSTSFHDQEVLVLGTEEFMFPPLYFAAYLESRCGCRSVRFHATTRSPILPSTEEGYPISSRFRVRSVYDPERTTYIYNLKSYDRVIILHDSAGYAQPGIDDLCTALARQGCRNISVFKWGV